MNDSRVDLLLGMITTFPSAVSNFGLLPTLKVLAGTLNSLSRNNITTSSTTKYTLLTFTIYPDLARIWQYYVHKNANISDHIHLMVVDCSGLLDTKIFSSGSLFRFWNYVHSVKIDHFIQKVIKTPYVWLCDDDIFIINPEWMTRCNKFFTLSNQSSVVSFAPRRWSFEIKNQKIPVMGSYCLIFNREVFIREKLSFGCVHSQNKMIGRGTGYYDTGDYANEQLLKRNYDIQLYDGRHENIISGFSGTDSARLILMKGKDHFLSIVKNSEPGLACYRLVGAYCVCKVDHLYREIFKQPPQWVTPINENDLQDLAKSLPSEWYEKIKESFSTYDNVYMKLKSDIKKCHD